MRAQPQAMSGDAAKAKRALAGAVKAAALIIVVILVFLIGAAFYDWSAGHLGGGPVPFLIALLIGAVAGYVAFQLALWVLGLVGLSL